MGEPHLIRSLPIRGYLCNLCFKLIFHLTSKALDLKFMRFEVEEKAYFNLGNAQIIQHLGRFVFSKRINSLPLYNQLPGNCEVRYAIAYNMIQIFNRISALLLDRVPLLT